MAPSSAKIAFQGLPGAYSHQACQEFDPGLEPLPCTSFEDAVAAVRDGAAERAMLPVDNSLYGRVADIHHLLPESGLHIIAEHFLPIRLQLLGRSGARLNDIREAASHVVALGQCRDYLRRNDIQPRPVADTAGAAKALAEKGEASQAAIASGFAADIYGLEVLAADIEDEAHNTTRFLVMGREPEVPAVSSGMVMTTFVFAVRNVPAALYKALGGFATNGVNMVKLESYMVGGSFFATQFYADIEGHPEDQSVRLAFEELLFFCKNFHILGTYPAHPYRQKVGEA